MSFQYTEKRLLKDSSWIKKPDDEEEDVDRDPNFGKSILGRYKSTESIGSLGSDERVVSPTSSVQALTRRFTGSTDDLQSSSPTSSRVSSTYRSSTITTSNERVSETTISTTQSLRSPGFKSPTKTETFMERVQSSSKGAQYATYSPTRTTRLSETTTSSDNIAEDKLYNSLIPSSIKDGSSTRTETYTVRSSSNGSADDLNKPVWDDESKSETVTVTRSTNGDSLKSTTSTRLSTAEDELYDSLLPKAITSPVSSSVTRRDIITVERSNVVESPPSPSSTRTTSYSSYSDENNSYSLSKPSSLVDDFTSERKSYSYSSRPSTYEYSSISSPTDYSSMSSTSYRSRSEDADPVYSKSSTSSLYSPRSTLEKDQCTTCRKPFTGDAKIILDDMRINCHASCFKCEVCNRSLEHLKAGDSMWIYNRMVHCENCFESTREKWRR